MVDTKDTAALSAPPAPCGTPEAAGRGECLILTTHQKNFLPAWTRRTVLLPGWFEAHQKANQSIWRSAYWAWRLFRESRRYKAVVTGAEHTGMFFALMQSLFRRPSRRCVHVMDDFIWAASPGALMLALKRLELNVAARSIDCIFAHASPEQEERFANALHLPRSKFRFVHAAYYVDPLPASEGDYIFAGGDTSRDFQTLLRALAGSHHRTVICTHQLQQFEGQTIPDNIEITTVTPERFNELLAGAAVIVIPVPARELHTGGHTVITVAMMMGKVVIVAGRAEYSAYIENGKTGLLVPSGDSEALRAAIDRVMEDREFARELSRNAKAASPMFAPETFFATVFSIVDEALRRRKIAPSGDRRL